MIALKVPKKQYKCNFHYEAMLMVTSQILRSADFAKSQKPKYLENETFSLQIKKFIKFHIKAYFMAKNSLVAEVTFKSYFR